MKNLDRRLHAVKGTSSYKSLNKLLQVVNKLCSHCLFLVCCKKFETICQQLVTGLMVLSDGIYKVVLTSLTIQNVTTLTTQGCNNIVISRLYQGPVVSKAFSLNGG